MGDDTKPGEEGPGEANAPLDGGTNGPAALKVIGAFGGIRPMASKLDVPVSTVQGWKERGVIPEARHGEVRAAAAAHGVALDDADLAASAEAPGEAEAEGEGTGDGGIEIGANGEQAEASRDATETEASEAPADAIAPAAAAAAAPQSERGGRGGWASGFVLGALVLAVGAGGAVLTKDIWDPQAGGSGGAALEGGGAELTDQLAAISDRLSDLETQPAAGLPDNLATSEDLARIEGELAALSGGGELSTRMDHLAGQLAELDGRLAAMGASANAGAEAADAVGGLSGEVAAIEGRLDELSAAFDDLAARDAGQEAMLWSAVGALRDALRYTGPFSAQLADVDRLAGDREDFQAALAELKPLADGGVASLAELQRDFPDAARDIVAAGYGEDEDGMLGDVLNRVSQVVTVRPVGDVEGDSPGAIVARAETHLGAGDLAAAVEELKGLPEGAGEAASPWRERAEQRLAADAAITQLNGLLAGHTAAGG